MSPSLQDLAEYLLAGGGDISIDPPGLVLVSQEGEELYARTVTVSGLGDQVSITPSVRDGSPVLYLQGGTQPHVFSVNPENVLQHFKFNEEEDEWEELKPDNVQKAEVHSSSQLSGDFAVGGQIVFFEDSSGLFQGIQIQDNTGEWEALPPVPVSLQKGAAHSARVTPDNVLHLMYVHQDSFIHHLAHKIGTTEWHDTILPGSKFDNDLVRKFLPAPNEDQTFRLFVLTSKGELVLVDASGAQTKLGKIVQGHFEPASSKEEAIETFSWIVKGIEKIKK